MQVARVRIPLWVNTEVILDGYSVPRVLPCTAHKAGLRLLGLLPVGVWVWGRFARGRGSPGRTRSPWRSCCNGYRWSSRSDGPVPESCIVEKRVDSEWLDWRLKVFCKRKNRQKSVKMLNCVYLTQRVLQNDSMFHSSSWAAGWCTYLPLSMEGFDCKTLEHPLKAVVSKRFKNPPINTPPPPPLIADPRTLFFVVSGIEGQKTTFLNPLSFE